jgi:hypothetical protein
MNWKTIIIAGLILVSGNGMDIGLLNAFDGSITMQMRGAIDYSKR